jgi:ABC-type Fe3+ transport system permease subunit
MPMEDKWGFIYFSLIVFLIPLVMIVLIYIQIVKYMKQNPFSTTNRSNVAAQHRQQSELRLIRRTLTIVTVLFILGFPYTFIFIGIEIHLMPP